MAFLSGFYNRLSGAFGQPSETETTDQNITDKPRSDSTNDNNDASSRTLSPDERGDVDTPEKAPALSASRVPPTPSFAPPATPFAGHLSPAVNQAAADQLRREAESFAPKMGATPFFGIFAPPHTPATRNLSPVRNLAAEEQLQREMMGNVPETHATLHTKSKATPMTQYKTPAMSQSTPNEPSTAQSLAADAFQTPSIMPSRRQRQNHSPIQEESEIVFANVEMEPQKSESEASAASSPREVVDMDLSSADENDTSTTSVESSDAEKRRAVAIPTNKGRRNTRRQNQRNISKTYEDRKRRVQKPARPGVGRSVSGREELLNRARKRFYDRRTDGDRLF